MCEGSGLAIDGKRDQLEEVVDDALTKPRLDHQLHLKRADLGGERLFHLVEFPGKNALFGLGVY